MLNDGAEVYSMRVFGSYWGRLLKRRRFLSFYNFGEIACTGETVLRGTPSPKAGDFAKFLEFVGAFQILRKRLP